jgi:hypothetical protein
LPRYIRHLTGLISWGAVATVFDLAPLSEAQDQELNTAIAIDETFLIFLAIRL